MRDPALGPHCPVDTRPLVLASASPRRQALLRTLGLRFEVDPAQVDETIEDDTDIAALVCRLADHKASHVALRHKGALLIAADTLVSLDGRILGKPVDADDACAMLRRLSGRGHRVYTGLSVLDTDTNTIWRDVVETDVYFRDLSDAEIELYVASGEPLDKAGAYGAQGLGATLIDRIHGDYFNVIGLPLSSLNGLLQAAGTCILCRRQQDAAGD
jgi:septum formation protein